MSQNLAQLYRYIKKKKKKQVRPFADSRCRVAETCHPGWSMLAPLLRWVVMNRSQNYHANNHLAIESPHRGPWMCMEIFQGNVSKVIQVEASSKVGICPSGLGSSSPRLNIKIKV